jgi:hypothetical protein
VHIANIFALGRGNTLVPLRILPLPIQMVPHRSVAFTLSFTPSHLFHTLLRDAIWHREFDFGIMRRVNRRRGGRVAEGDGLLNRYTESNPYPGFESPPLRFWFRSCLPTV